MDKSWTKALFIIYIAPYRETQGPCGGDKQHDGSSRKSALREATQHKKKASSQLESTKSVLFCRRKDKQQ